jgi:hypothetical protein
MAILSQAYFMGIRDERALMREMQARGEYEPKRDAPAMLDTIQRTLAQGYAGEMADYMRGGRDFWRNQCKLALAIP